MNKQELAFQIQKASQLKGSFKLRSGRISNIYFDKYQFESRPELLDSITDHLMDMIPHGIDILGGMEMGGIPLAAALSLKTKKPCVFIRKQAKKYGTEKQAEGCSVLGKKVLLIEDVITTGGAVCSSAELIKKAGGIAEHTLCVIYRGESPALLDSAKLKLHSLFQLKDGSLES